MESSETLSRVSPSRWVQAYRGTKRSVRADSRFFVLSFSAAAVSIAAATLDADLLQWSVLLVCMTAVFAAEMFHAAIHRLCGLLIAAGHRAAGEVVEIGQAAVMVVTMGSAVVSMLILVHRLRVVLGLG